MYVTSGILRYDIGVHNILCITVNSSFNGNKESAFEHNFGISYIYLHGWVIASVISEQVSDWVREWQSEWVTECMREWRQWGSKCAMWAVET